MAVRDLGKREWSHGLARVFRCRVNKHSQTIIFKNIFHVTADEKRLSMLNKSVFFYEASLSFHDKRLREYRIKLLKMFPQKCRVL